jgi:hypothetical protein
MIIAKGFTDPDAKYQTFSTFRNANFKNFIPLCQNDKALEPSFYNIAR